MTVLPLTSSPLLPLWHKKRDGSNTLSHNRNHPKGYTHLRLSKPRYAHDKDSDNLLIYNINMKKIRIGKEFSVSTRFLP